MYTVYVSIATHEVNGRWPTATALVAVLSPAEYLPAAQAWHVLVPFSRAYVPTGQYTHVGLPVADASPCEDRPAGQSKHVT
jgi:hypothetical protein